MNAPEWPVRCYFCGHMEFVPPKKKGGHTKTHLAAWMKTHGWSYLAGVPWCGCGGGRFIWRMENRRNRGGKKNEEMIIGKNL